MTRRNPTRTIIAVLAALVLVAVIAVVAYQLGQHTTGSPAPSPTAGSSTVASGSSPSPAPGSPSTGSSQPGLPQGPARVGEGGHMTGPAGLPLGYDHTETGAVQAATNYLTWMNSLRIKDKTTADAMATATAADPATRAAMIASFDDLRTGLDDVTEARTEVTRGAYAIPNFGPASASIYVWAPYVVTDTSGETVTAWGIFEIPLIWRDDWKLDGALISRIGGAAVEPGDPSANPKPSEKQDILSRTPSDPGEITDSAEQSWLEYANAAR